MGARRREDSEDTGPFRDAYLARSPLGSPADLDAAWRPALRLGWVCRAVNGHVPGDDGRRTRGSMFLDGLL